MLECCALYQVAGDAQARAAPAAVSSPDKGPAAAQQPDDGTKEHDGAPDKPTSAAVPAPARIPVSASAAAASMLPPVPGQGEAAQCFDPVLLSAAISPAQTELFTAKQALQLTTFSSTLPGDDSYSSSASRVTQQMHTLCLVLPSSCRVRGHAVAEQISRGLMTNVGECCAGQRASVMRQTQAALGLWAQLHDTASTPSTVLQPFSSRRSESAAVSQSTDQSAA